MRLAQILSIGALIGTLLCCWSAWRVVTGERRWPAKLWSVAIVLAALFLSWFLIVMHLIPSSLNY
jgi:sugar phosphate permease